MILVHTGGLKSLGLHLGKETAMSLYEDYLRKVGFHGKLLERLVYACLLATDDRGVDNSEIVKRIDHHFPDDSIGDNVTLSEEVETLLETETDSTPREIYPDFCEQTEDEMDRSTAYSKIQWEVERILMTIHQWEEDMNPPDWDESEKEPFGW